MKWTVSISCWILTSVMCGVLLTPCQANTTITLAYLAHHNKGDYKHVGGAFFLAVEDHRDILKPFNISVEWVVKDTKGEDVTSYRQMMDIVTSHNVTAFFGPDHYCSCAAAVASALDHPYMAYDCVYVPNEEHMKKYSVVNTEPSDIKVARFILGVIVYHNWTSYTIISGTSDRWKVTSRTLSTLTTESNISTNAVKEYPENDRYSPTHGNEIFQKMIESTRHGTRVYVFLGAYDSLIHFLVAMHDLGLTNSGKYAVIATDLDRKNDNPRSSRYFQSLDEEFKNKYQTTEEERLKAFRNVVVLMRRTTVTEQWKNTSSLIDARNREPPINRTRPSWFQKPPLSLKAAYLYDAVKLYIEAVKRVAETGGDIFNTSVIVDQMRNRTYKSIYGLQMNIDDKGDNDGNYTAWSVRVTGTSVHEDMVNVGMFIKGDGNPSSVKFRRDKTNSIGWVLGKPPPSEPACGFKGEKCDKEQLNVAVIVVCSVIGVIVVIILVLAFRHYLYEQKLARLLWKINKSEIKFHDERDINTNRKPKRMYHRWTSLLMPKDSELEDLCPSTPRAEHDLTIGSYRGTQVVIKQVTKKTLEISRSLKKQLQRRKELNHDNINRFVGACIETPQIFILSQYCARRSLHDIIQNEDSPLDEMFVSSLLADLIKGMTFIHDSRIISHGNLKSTNCLVDSRWVLQITDFGLHALYSSSQSLKDEIKHYNRLQWKAPELLRDGVHEHRGTPKGDVYAFGLILYDIHGRKGPWGATSMTPKEIVQKVRERRAETPFRPTTECLKCQDYIIRCMKDCWAENPESRPEFKVIKNKLRDMHHGLKTNIFDNMLAMMEKYATNLEKQVAERTQELSLEKRMTENLLLRMLPRSVAERLKQNEPVIPEQYGCVSVYFSDIVGFTTISAQSTPMQVVDFLNDLYICFDAVIENYDVYKVETIGDAYMVVSGLPIRNEDRHAGEVASLSLHVLKKIKNFRIRHMPEATVKIRIGLHSGPCCAGVVGLKMPRYCLFGDTVNTASRMESTGEALKIHCSQQCKEKLDILGGYQLQERGMVNMKGKGEQKTYFLMHEDPGHRVRRISQEKMTGREGRCVSMGNLDYASKPFLNPNPYRNSRMLPNPSDSHQRSSGHVDKLPVTQELVSMQEDDSAQEEPSETLQLLSGHDSTDVRCMFENEGRVGNRYGRTLSCDDVVLNHGNSWGPVVYSRSNSRT